MADPRDGIAIVGMAAVFPGAPTLTAFWDNIRDGVDAITDAPAHRWDPVYYDPDSDGAARFYCRRGGFIDDVSTFDPLAYGVMPSAAEGIEPDQLLSLDAAAAALRDAGYPGEVPSPDRTGVVLGRGGYITAGMARVDQYVRTAEQLARSLRQLVPELDEDRIDAVKRSFRDALGPVRADHAIGLVPNLAASRIANRFDFRGPAYTLDAACASSLVAVDQACESLRSGKADLMLAGGVHICHDATFWAVFTQLGALSRAQQIRPFDRRADGLLIGEGVGVLALERLEDAERRGHRVYAVIRGVGVSSDGRGASLMAPRVDGQTLALQRAWAQADLDPTGVGLIEAHGTGTPAGDAAELRTLRTVFGDQGERIPLGSVKSMIGHAMPAAGAAGLIKAALALHHRQRPPTLHCDEPHESLDGSRFWTPVEASPWDGPLVAGVNAFGFGGIDAHVVMEAHDAPTSKRRRARSGTSPSPLALFAADTPEALARVIAGEEQPTPGGPCRLALFDPTPKRRAFAATIAARGSRWHGRKDLWVSPEPLLADGGVAFVFPGFEATFEPRIDDVAAHFDLPLAADRQGTDLEQRGTQLLAVSRILDQALGRIGVQPDLLAGHSVGEWCAMVASGIVPPDQVDAFLDALGPGSLDVPDVAFLAVGCGAEDAAALVGDEVDISHDNCPHQSILCGRDEAIEDARQRLVSEGILCQSLPFRSGFHSPSFEPYLSGPRRHLEGLPLATPHTAMWSATTCAPYPDAPDAVRDLVVDHLTKPVRFRQLTDALYAQAIRAFVQVGPGSLTGFINDTLRDQPHLTVSANDPKRSGLEQLRRVAAALWCEGYPVEVDQLPGHVEHARPSRARPLKLGAPLVSLPPELALRTPPRVDATVDVEGLSPAVAAELQQTTQAFAEAQAQIAEALRQRNAASGPAQQDAGLGPRQRTTTATFSLDAFPFLIDHCFYRQPDGWPDARDRFPVVPMTMQLDRMLREAQALVPELTPVAIESVRAFRWCAVAPPVEVEIRSTFDGTDQVHVRIGDYAVGTVRLAATYPSAPPLTGQALADAEPLPIDAADVYRDRWMFHGPAYHGLARLDDVSASGITGLLKTREATGALLDNAGQLMGFWIMWRKERDRLAFPTRIDRLAFYGPHPAPGEHLECRVDIREAGDIEVTADIELVHNGTVWCTIEGWVGRRFDTDDVIWPTLVYPEKNGVSERQQGGYELCPDRWNTAASRELIARRYLSATEREAWDARGPRSRRGWLMGRLAAKDAVRRWLWDHGDGDRFPVEIAVRNDPEGKPLVDGPFDTDLRVSIAHKNEVGVAIVAEGETPGIDIETIEPRPEEFSSLAFSASELALAHGDDPVEWQTRLWAAKEAAAKAAGTGLGNPRHTTIRQRDGSRLLVESRDGAHRWISTLRHGTHVVAWTDHPPTSP